MIAHYLLYISDHCLASFFLVSLLNAALDLVKVCRTGGLKISRVSFLSTSVLVRYAGRSPGERCHLRVERYTPPLQQKL